MFKKRVPGCGDVMRSVLFFACSLLLAACSGKKDALVIFDVQTAADVPAFTQYRFSLVGNAAPSIEYAAETAANRLDFKVGYYLAVSGDVTVLAEALTDEKCVVGQRTAMASGLEPGHLSPGVIPLPIAALATPLCPSDGGAPGAGGGSGGSDGSADTGAARDGGAAGSDGATSEDAGGADRPLVGTGGSGGGTAGIGGGIGGTGGSVTGTGGTVGTGGALGTGGAGSVCSIPCAPTAYCDQGVCKSRITEFTIPTVSADADDITAGPDGNLWFTEAIGKIGSITVAGSIAEFDIPTAASNPTSITSGPDGNIWFTEDVGNKIGRISPPGGIVE
jgi:hypothetical protein